MFSSGLRSKVGEIFWAHLRRFGVNILHLGSLPVKRVFFFQRDLSPYRAISFPPPDLSQIRDCQLILDRQYAFQSFRSYLSNLSFKRFCAPARLQLMPLPLKRRRRIRIAAAQTKMMLDYGTRIIAGITPRKGGDNAFQSAGVPVAKTLWEIPLLVKKMT
jgi:hypothetical protein